LAGFSEAALQTPPYHSRRFDMQLIQHMLPLLMVAFAPCVSAYNASDDAPRVASKVAGGAPGAAQLQVWMLGSEVNGTHVVDHMATLDNPAGRVSLALPPGGCGSRELVTVTSQTHRPRCKFAVNAGYFNVHNGACIGNVVSHGSIIQTVPVSDGNVNFGIKNGIFHIGYIAPEEMPGYDMMLSGVVWLVRNGKHNVDRAWKEANTTVQTSGDMNATNLASRTAMGWDKDGRLMVLQMDGSIAVGDNKRGMDRSMLADAINLDGGGSSAMAVDGVLMTEKERRRRQLTMRRLSRSSRVAPWQVLEQDCLRSYCCLVAPCSLAWAQLSSSWCVGLCRFEQALFASALELTVVRRFAPF